MGLKYESHGNSLEEHVLHYAIADEEQRGTSLGNQLLQEA